MSEMLPPIIARLTADVAEFKAAMLEAAHSEEEMVSKGSKGAKDLESAHSELDKKTTGFAGHMQSLFGSLGNTMGNWGIPFGESVSKMGDKLGEAETKGQKFGATMSSVGKATLLAGTAGFAVVAAESIKMASSFQSASEHLVTDAGESQSALKGVESGMLAISAATGTSAADITNGMYHIESAGYHGAAGLQLLKTAAEGAKVGGADLDTVAQTLTGTMRAYNIPASQSVSVMNELVATVGSGDMRMQDLASSLGNVAPVAAAAHISLAQVGGAIATMTAQNMSAQQATQDLAFAIRSLQAPMPAAAKEMAQFGINSLDVSAHLGERGLTGTLSVLTQAIASKMGPSGQVLLNTFNQSTAAAQDMKIELAAMSPQLQALAEKFANGSMTVKDYRTAIKSLPADQQAMASGFISTYNQAHKFNSLLTSGLPAYKNAKGALEVMMGGATGLNTALMLTGGNAAEFQKNVDTISASSQHAGKNVDNWNQIQKTFSQQMDVAKTTVEDLGIKLGLVLIPVLETVAKDTMDVVNWFEKHKAAAEALAGVIGGVLAAAVGAFAVNKIGEMVKGVGKASKTLIDLGKDVAKVGPKFVELGQKTVAFASEYGRQIGQAVMSTARFVISHAVAAGEFVAQNVAMAASATAAFVAENAATLGIVAGIAVLIAGIVWAATHWQQTWAAIKAVAGDAWHLLDGVWHSIDHTIRSVWGGIESFFRQMWSDVVGLFRADVSMVESVLTGAWTRISGGVTGLWHDVVHFFGQMWSDVEGAESSGISSIVGFFERLPGEIMSDLSGLLSDLVSFGENIIHSIVQGIGNMGSSIFDAIKSHIPGSGIVGHALGAIGLAEGGIVTKPTLAVVGEAGYPEAVIPLKNGISALGFNADTIPLPAAPVSTPGATSTAPGATSQTIQVNMVGSTTDPMTLAHDLAWELRPYLAGVA